MVTKIKKHGYKNNNEITPDHISTKKGALFFRFKTSNLDIWRMPRTVRRAASTPVTMWMKSCSPEAQSGKTTWYVVLQLSHTQQLNFKHVDIRTMTYPYISYVIRGNNTVYHARALSLRGGYAQPRQVQTRKLCLSRAPSALYTKVPATCSRN